MDKQQFISELENDISSLLNDDLLNNFKNQIYAWKLNASFNKTFKENYLWNRALFLTTNSCLLLQNYSDNKIAIKGLKEGAEIYEYLSDLPEISEKYDRNFLILLSALCYDISGYQANGYCVANRLINYVLETDQKEIAIETDNLIIKQIIYVLLKKIPYANYDLNLENPNVDIGFILFKKAMNTWYEHILKLSDGDYIFDLDNVYKYYLNTGNTYLSHLVFLLKTRVLLFNNRSIWDVLSENENVEDSGYWRKYIKLLAQDLYSDNEIKELDKRKSIFEFWTSQLRAIEHGLMDLDESFVVQMPTSAGKTFIAELAILKNLINHPNKKCLYIAPFRALTSEKEIEIGKYLSKLGFSISSLSGSYEVDEFQNVLISEADIIIATPEKIDLLLRTNPDFFHKISFMVVDEGHIIGDISARASLLEFLIIRLKIKIPDLNTLFISAVMPSENANEYALWLSGKENNVLRSLMFKNSKVNEEWEPTRKLIGKFFWEGNNGKIEFKEIFTKDEDTKITQNAFIPNYLKHREFGGKYPTKNNKPETTGALAYKLSQEGNTLVFCSQPRQTEWISKRIMQIIDLQPKEKIPEYFRANRNRESYYYSKLWYGEEYYITQAIMYGIGIHFGDMPEQVRSAVENDYREGNLRVLLSSNTVGQGLNLPIKNLIFYDLRIDYKNEPIHIKKRDFLNIVGRAGRAGKETEGKIIFVINSDFDKNLYDDFSDKGNIENADSLIFKVLDDLQHNRINEQDFENNLSILSEPYLLDLMTEEIIDTDYEEVIEKIINNSLFKVQIEKRNLEIDNVKRVFYRIFKKFEEGSTFEQLNTYKQTGFSYKSNLIINDYIDSKIAKLNEIIDNDDYLQLLDVFLDLLETNPITEFNDPKLIQTIPNPIQISGLIKDWISGKGIQEIRNKWLAEGKKVRDLQLILSKALFHYYPWGISSFIIILSHKLEIKLAELPTNIRNLASYVKYGVNNSASCLARSLGIKGREVSEKLYDKSGKLEGKDFIRWLSNLTYEEISTYDISKFDEKNLITTSLKLTQSSHRELPNYYQFPLKGTYYHDDWSITSKKVHVGERLKLSRDVYNKFDPYAIIISKGISPIGYVPREYSKIISAEIDIEETEYQINVLNILEKEKYNEIVVGLRKLTNLNIDNFD